MGGGGGGGGAKGDNNSRNTRVEEWKERAISSLVSGF